MSKAIQEIDRQIKEARRAAYNSPFTTPEQKTEAIKLIEKLNSDRLAKRREEIKQLDLKCDCHENFNCCDCGGVDCGCAGCFSCNACEACKK